MKEYTKELMEFVLSLRYEDLPPEAVELAKRHELIYQAIAERDMVRARAEIEEHFDMLIAGLEKLDA